MNLDKQTLFHMFYVQAVKCPGPRLSPTSEFLVLLECSILRDSKALQPC